MSGGRRAVVSWWADLVAVCGGVGQAVDAFWAGRAGRLHELVTRGKNVTLVEYSPFKP